MKKYKLIFALTMCAIMINACSEDDLELTNPNQLSPETFFKNEAQVQSAVNAVYANLQTRGLYTRHIFFMMDFMSHENDPSASSIEADKLQYFNFSFDSSHGAIRAYWDACFRGINKANFVLGNQEAINAIPDSQLSSARKAKFIGEAKYLRAFYYFLLVTRYGDVPLITIIPEDGNGFARSPKSAVYDQIILDLTDATGTLLDKDDEENGRATKGAALAMLGKVQLYLENYTAAMSAFNQLSGYSLEADYFDNFLEETEHGPESIFEVEFDDEDPSNDHWNSTFSGAGVQFITFRGQEYGFNDWFNAHPSDNILDEFEAGDPRYDDSFYFNGDTFAGGTVNITTGERAGWRKYQNYYKDANEDQQSGINMKVIRYADVLLMMAECENASGGQDNAVGFINEVRDRVGMTLLPTGMSQSDVFDAIVHERKVELAGEQVRFPDIVRWGNAATELSGTNFQAGKHEIFPIPDAEMSSNENINQENQNPGY